MWLNYIYFCIILGYYVIEADAAPKRRYHKKAYRRQKENGKEIKENNCWMTLKAKDHFVVMEALEEKFAKVRKEYDEVQFVEGHDDEMLGNLLDKQGAANRETQKAGNRKNLIPSGINLGGYSMMRMPDSVMFFHRMKLRNDTRFRVNYLTSNFSTMTMTSQLSLNDLHMVGNYERVQTKQDPSVLQYSPKYGEIEVLLRDVYYNMEGRYRMQKDMIYLEMVLSELSVPINGILMLYTNSSDKQQQILQTKNYADFLDRLKTDLDLWMKDFYNEFLLYESPANATKQFLQYDKERIVTLNRYVDKALKFLKNRLRALKADIVKLPSFVIHSFNGVVLQLNGGYLTGLDTMYRRSMATNSVEKDVRKVDALIAFSSLKARYSYEVKLTTGAPPLYGSLILSGDELSAIMSISMVKEPLFVDLKFDFIRQLKPESLTIEGSAGRIISTFKHLLELHITAILTNTMIDQVKQLSTLTKCVPSLVSYDNEGDQDAKYYKGIDESREESIKYQKLNSRDPCGPDSPFHPCTWPPGHPNEPHVPSDLHGMSKLGWSKRTRLPIATRTRPMRRTITTPTSTTTTTPTTTTTAPTTTTTTPTTTTTTPSTTTTTPTTTTTIPTSTTTVIRRTRTRTRTVTRSSTTKKRCRCVHCACINCGRSHL